MRAARPSRALAALSAPLVRRRVPGPGVRLSFDDGPHPEFTPPVLELLARFGATADFFAIGERAAARPDLIAATLGAGHGVGNHTLTHPRLGWGEARAARAEVAGCQAVLAGLGAAPTSFRAPHGRLTPGLALAARRHGLSVRHWSLDSNDWRCRTATDAAECAESTAALAKSGDVILLHDANPWIGAILGELLPALARRGLVGG